MQSTFVQHDMQGHWRNTHYVDRQTWLSWPWPEPARPTLIQHLRRLLDRLGGQVNTLPPGDGPDNDQRH